ncbi:MAG TPA: endonuclease, partial [Gemmatimonadetes bacterium]|nr:endonuclease [Gemmatimonadota bacterium]
MPRDFIPTSSHIIESSVHDDGTIHQFDELAPHIRRAASRIVTRILNGNSKDSLDYVDSEGVGRSFIAIGGDRLSRGLTLEGLAVSYYARPSRMYDTLMQMGRWFGYRPGYLDLCR